MSRFRLRSRAALAAAILTAFALGLATVAGAGARPSSQGDDPGQPQAGVDYVDGRALIKFLPGTPAAAKAAAHNAAGGRVLNVIPGIDVHVVEVGKGRTLDALTIYARNPNVLFAEVDGIAHALIDCTEDAGTFSNDDCSWRQWGLDNDGQDYGVGTGTNDADVDIPEAWGTGYLGNGVIIASLDTGFDQTHEDVASKVQASADFTGDGIEDGHGHGTWTASIAAGITNNATGVAGTSSGARLIVAKVLNNSGAGSWSWIASGITWAADYEAGTPTIISMSLGGACRGGPLFGCDTLKSAVNYAHDTRGALLIAAAGNSGGSSPEWPGAHEDVIAVAATTPDDTIASFSNAGEIAAPGVNIIGAFPDCDGGSSFTLRDDYGLDCRYDHGSGTSASTPIAAGVAAILWSADLGQTNDQVRTLIKIGAHDIPGTSYDGAGRITACGALDSLANVSCSEGGGGGGSDAPPVVDVAGPANGATVSGTVEISATVTDNTGVTSVTYSIDGGTPVAMSLSSGTDASGTWTASWDSTGVGDGLHTITVTATDDGSQSVSDSVEVTVDNVAEGPGALQFSLSSQSINNGSTWTAVVTITVTDGNGALMPDAVVSGSWSTGGSDSSCTTGISGTCTVSSSQHKRVSSATYTVNTVNGSSDFGGDTSIVVNKP